jgi:hypothetical protein
VIALIGGTSNCHMAASRQPHFVPGVWGPYFGAMVPDLWLTEGGQSAAGALIDYAIENSAAYPTLAREARDKKTTVYALLNERVQALADARHLAHPAYLTRDLHVLDYHLGNRSPIADPRARGVVDGLSLDTGPDALALLYLATLQAVAYGTRHIIEAMNAHGFAINKIWRRVAGRKTPCGCANTPTPARPHLCWAANPNPCCWAPLSWARRRAARMGASSRPCESWAKAARAYRLTEPYAPIMTPSSLCTANSIKSSSDTAKSCAKPWPTKRAPPNFPLAAPLPAPRPLIASANYRQPTRVLKGPARAAALKGVAHRAGGLCARLAREPAPARDPSPRGTGPQGKTRANQTAAAARTIQMRRMKRGMAAHAPTNVAVRAGMKKQRFGRVHAVTAKGRLCVPRRVHWRP